jgi:1-deoxy-D-xylulose-5-phosphate synthase
VKYTLLKHINSPEDLKKLSPEQLPTIAKELRDFIISILATKEGHLGASLGVVELTLALHYVFNTPDDKLIWDVGHQAYAHKILTGRKDIFDTNRQFGGISGFPKMAESIFDAFGTGHSSTSISAALGMAMASQIKGEYEKQHIAVIGDASIASGMAFEGLNHAGVTNSNLLVILNDNAIGIDPSVGALKQYLTKAKVGFKPKQSNMIEALSFNYSGPIDGHDLPSLLKELERLQKIKGPKFLHVITTKGKGLKQAEQDQVKYHAPGKFDKITGELQPKKQTSKAPKYQDVFGLTLVELAKKNEKIIGITPAMPTGSSLKYMIEEFPNRAFDVGIAEQHAVTLAAGMASEGMIPYCTIYSTFIQRAYDQIIHDVAIQNLPVIFCLDRAGLVGEDGATHHGVYDISFLRCIPNLILFAPMNEIDLRNILYTVQLGKLKKPIAIRYPRGQGNNENWQQPFEEIEFGKGRIIKEGNTIAVLSIGTIGSLIEEITNELPSETGDKIAHYNMLFIKPLDKVLLTSIFEKFTKIITIEDHSIKGGFGSEILEFSQENNYSNTVIKRLGIPDKFIEHGAVDQLKRSIQLDKDSIKKSILENL